MLAAADAAMYIGKTRGHARRLSSGQARSSSPPCPRATPFTAPRAVCSRLSGRGWRSSRRTRARQATGIAPRIDGRVLESVEAVGKNLLLTFEGGIVVRSHLRMTGRWRIEPRGKQRTGLPWLVLRGDELEGVLWNGPVLTLETQRLRRLGQDVLAEEFDLEAAVARLRGAGDRWLGEALQDQRLVAGIGNMWMAEALWTIEVSPWVRVQRRPDETRCERASVPRAG